MGRPVVGRLMRGAHRETCPCRRPDTGVSLRMFRYGVHRAGEDVTLSRARLYAATGSLKAAQGRPRTLPLRPSITAWVVAVAPGPGAKRTSRKESGRLSLAWTGIQVIGGHNLAYICAAFVVVALSLAELATLRINAANRRAHDKKLATA